jgi:RecA-family ATPase
VHKLYGDVDEISAGDIALLMNELERLAVKSRASGCIFRSFQQGNQSTKESIDRVSRSGVFAGHPDSILRLTKDLMSKPLSTTSTRWSTLFVKNVCLNPGTILKLLHL